MYCTLVVRRGNPADSQNAQLLPCCEMVVVRERTPEHSMFRPSGV